MHDVLSILSISQCWLTSNRHCFYIFLVYIVDIAMLSTSSRHRFYIVIFQSCFINEIVDVTIFTNIESTLCLHRDAPSSLFTSSTLSASQCWSTSSRYLSTLLTFFLVYIVDIVYIAMLIGIESTSCQHRTFFILFS